MNGKLLTSEKIGDYTIYDFTYSETATSYSIDNSLTCEYYDNAKLTLLCLSLINHISEKKHSITSGFRCTQVNTLVGGVINSLHQQALAVDFACLKNECNGATRYQFQVIAQSLVDILYPDKYCVEVYLYDNKNYFHLEINEINV